MTTTNPNNPTHNIDHYLHGTTLSAKGLRAVLTTIFEQHARPLSISEIVHAVQHQGFTISPKAGKTISDLLRTETRNGRVRRTGRGLYQRIGTTRQYRWRATHRANHFKALLIQQQRGSRPHQRDRSQTQRPRPPTTQQPPHSTIQTTPTPVVATTRDCTPTPTATPPRKVAPDANKWAG